jgi:hypothetical protein
MASPNLAIATHFTVVTVTPRNLIGISPKYCDKRTPSEITKKPPRMWLYYDKCSFRPDMIQATKLTMSIPTFIIVLISCGMMLT